MKDNRSSKKGLKREVENWKRCCSVYVPLAAKMHFGMLQNRQTVSSSLHGRLIYNEGSKSQ